MNTTTTTSPSGTGSGKKMNFTRGTGATSGRPYIRTEEDKLMGQNYLRDIVIYASRFKYFEREDWYVYFAWVGLMSGLIFSILGFMMVGFVNNVQYPAYAWNVPIGTAIFILSISFDTIGHRSAYKEALKSGEALVHHITIFMGITSCVLLCLAYTHRAFFAVPALVFTGLSVMYSVIDEAMHWKRYAEGNSDRVEMWAHSGIFIGHSIMMAAWVYWFYEGYPGVAETLQYLK
ncbi:MAG: hypothetical protein AB7P04_01965 [Bacteriovoracia bacterium]